MVYVTHIPPLDNWFMLKQSMCHLLNLDKRYTFKTMNYSSNVTQNSNNLTYNIKQMFS